MIPIPEQARKLYLRLDSLHRRLAATRDPDKRDELRADLARVREVIAEMDGKPKSRIRPG
jgi:hypothetical protein